MLNRAWVCHANALTLLRTPAGPPSPYSTACPSPGWRIRWHPTKVRGNGSEHQGRLWSSSHLLQVKGNTTTCLTKPCRFPATAASAPAAAGLLDCSGAAINAQANLLSSAPSALTSELWQHRNSQKSDLGIQPGKPDCILYSRFCESSGGLTVPGRFNRPKSGHNILGIWPYVYMYI